jgi:hypothetical protein
MRVNKITFTIHFITDPRFSDQKQPEFFWSESEMYDALAWHIVGAKYEGFDEFTETLQNRLSRYLRWLDKKGY